MVLHVEADAVVSNIVHILVFLYISSYFNDRNIAGLCELDGIRKKVDQNLFDKCMIPHCRR